MHKYLEIYKRLEDDWQNYLENKGKLTYEDMVLIKELINKEKAMKEVNNIRTEEEVLKDFEKLGYNVVANGGCFIKLNNNGDIIRISKYSMWYRSYCEDSGLAVPIDMEEHKLLNELFSIWGWL